MPKTNFNYRGITLLTATTNCRLYFHPIEFTKPAYVLVFCRYDQKDFDRFILTCIIAILRNIELCNHWIKLIAEINCGRKINIKVGYIISNNVNITAGIKQIAQPICFQPCY